MQPFTPAEQQIWDQSAQARYRLRPGDIFTVDFKYQDELDQRHISILPDGYFTMAGMENVKGLGLTIGELDSLVTVHFAKDYRNPELSIIIEELGKRQVYILGEVKDPGLRDLPNGPVGALQAVALAGGFLSSASPKHTVVIRVTPAGYLYRRCDLSHLEELHARNAALLELQPYDVIYVPRSFIGDFANFADKVLTGALRLSALFWDVYAVTHMDKVDRLLR